MWEITRDLIEKGRNEGITSKDWLRDVDLNFEYRLLDDDGKVYYYGISNDCNSQKAFAPLDDFGRDAGCTAIQYRQTYFTILVPNCRLWGKKKGEWVTL